MFRLRSINAIRRVPLSRALTSKESLLELTVDEEGIALMSLKRPPVNSMNLELLQEISTNFDVVKKSGCKGAVITSALTKVFSAGLDLNELNNPEPQRLRMFWSIFLDLFLKLYGSGETIAVAINGHAAAGACVLSLMCDYRVMVTDGKSKIGLNDTEVGIVPNPWVRCIMERAMGHRQAEIALTASTMFTAEEALQVNLVDETARDKKDAIEKCKQFIRRYDSIPLRIRGETKRSLRASVIRLVEGNREECVKLFIQDILDPYTQGQIAKFTQQLKQKKNKR